MPPKQFYTVTYLKLTHSLNASSAQNAVRVAIRRWIEEKAIKRQPKTDDAGGFVGVEVEIL